MIDDEILSVPTADPRVYMDVRIHSKTDLLVLREIWSENVYEVNEGTFDDTHIVLDIGANIGSFTIWAASKGAQKIIAFEPELNNLELLKKNLKNNAMVVGTCEVIVDSRGVGGSNKNAFITNEHGDSRVFDGVPENNLVESQIEIISLDQVFKEHKLEYVDCLKLDIEGMEGEVIINASKATLNLCRYITLEYDRQSNDLGAIVEKLSQTHQVKVVGEAGGMIFCRRY